MLKLKDFVRGFGRSMIRETGDCAAEDLGLERLDRCDQTVFHDMSQGAQGVFNQSDGIGIHSALVITSDVAGLPRGDAQEDFGHLRHLYRSHKVNKEFARRER
jgi:hypothetical protein